MSTAAARARRPVAKPVHPAPICFDGAKLNVDYASYLAQHDIVYLRRPANQRDAMAIGDGDLGGMVWFDNALRIQLQKSDLWADPRIVDGHEPAISTWRQLAAGALAIQCPTFDAPHVSFEQRLSLYSGILTITAETLLGDYSVTAFMSATAGVLVVHVTDHALRNLHRGAEVSLWRDAHPFAVEEHIGLLQSLQDRRYALVARIAERKFSTRSINAHTARLDIEPFRSGSFTLFATVATTPRSGDPVGMAKARLQAAVSRGYEKLLIEQRQHWNQFWQKSFISLSGPVDDPSPRYLEHLWYSTIYHLASCSRGHDAPLSNGALWLNDRDRRSDPAIYVGERLRRMTAPALAANHLELTAPYTTTYFRLLHDLQARTSCLFGLPGVQIPERFNRFGIPFDAPPADGGGAELPKLGDGLEVALRYWDCWRHAPEYMFLRDFVHPLLRETVSYAVELYCADTTAFLDGNGEVAAHLMRALEALIWSSRELELDEHLRDRWRETLHTVEQDRLPRMIDTPDAARDDAEALLATLEESHQLPQALFADESGSVDLAAQGEFAERIGRLLLCEDEYAITSKEDWEEGAPCGLLRVFPALPREWSGALMLAAPRGFRICAEALDGVARYVAIQSLFGGTCEIANPWGAGVMVRIRDGRVYVMESDEATLVVPTQKGTTYVIERHDLPLMRTLRARLRAKRATGPRALGDVTIGVK